MFRKVIGVIGLVLLVAACQAPTPTATPEPSPTPVPSPTLAPTATVGTVPLVAAIDPETRASLRLLIMAADAPAVDIYVESALAAGRLTYGRLTNPLPLAPGRYALRVVPAGSGITNPQALYSDFITLDPRESIIVVFGGSADALKLIRYTEDLSPLGSGQARVMVMNAMQDGTSASVTIGDQSIGSVESGGLASDPRVFAANRYTITVESGGKTLVNTNQSFQEKQAYTIVLLGSASGKPSLAVVNTPTRREVRLRLVNASSETGSLDVYLDNNRIATDLGYGKFTDWQSFSPRNAQVRLLPGGASPDSSPVFSGQIILPPDQTETLVIYNVPSTRSGETTFSPGISLVPENLQPVTSGNASFSVLNTARQAPQLKVLPLSRELAAIPPIDYGKASQSVLVPEGKINLGFSSLNTQPERAVDTLDGLEVKAGFAYLYVVVDNRQGNPPLLLSTEVGQQPLTPTATPTLVSPLQVRLINALSDVDALDAYVDQNLLFKAVKTGEGSVFVAIANQMSIVRITRTGGTDTLAQLQLLYQPDGLITLIAFGTAQKPSFVQSVEKPLPSTASLLRVFHAAPDVGTLTLESPETTTQPAGVDSRGNTPTPVVKTTQYVQSLPYGNISQAVVLYAGTYTFVAHNVNDYTVVAQVTDVRIERNKWYTLLILPGEGGAKIVVISADNVR